MSELFSNNAVSTLAGSLAAIGTSVTVQAGHGARFPSPGASDFFRLVLVRKSDGAWEIVFCTARSGDIMTITRAQESTVALALASGDVLELRPTAGFFTSLAVTSATIQNNTYTYDATDTGSANVCIIQPSTAIAAYVEGQEFWFKVGVTNTGASTLNVSALGTSPAIILPNGSALYAGALQATRIAHVVFDGTAFVLQNPYNFASVAGLITRTHTDINNLVTLAGAETLTNKTLTSPVLNSPVLNSPALNGSLSGTALLNDPTLALNLSYAVPSQQAVKAYVDNSIASHAAIFYGALIYKSTTQSIPNNSSTALTFTLESYDTSAIHDNAVNNSRLTVPSGASRVRLSGNCAFSPNITGVRGLFILKNTEILSELNGSTLVQSCIGGKQTQIQIHSPVLNVVAGDYFQLMAFQDSGAALNTDSNNVWFSMEIVL